MGADYILIRNCGLQSQLGPAEFAEAMKRVVQVQTLELMREQIEAQSGRPLEEVTISFGGTGEHSSPMTFAALKEATAPLADTSECQSCPLARGRDLGCYTYVRYPVDAAFERHFFDYFVAALQSTDPELAVGHDAEGNAFSAAALVKQVVMDPITEPVSWATQRGPAEEGGLAELAEPLQTTLASGEPLDSAQVLCAAFAPVLDGFEALMLYAHLFQGFFDYLDQHGIEHSTTIEEVEQLLALLTAGVPLARTGELGVLVYS